MHFAATLLAWKSLTANQFGLFALIILVVQQSFGVQSALIGTPLSVPPSGDAKAVAEHSAACLSINTPFVVVVSLAVYVVALLSASSETAILYSLFAGLANLRWSSRSEAAAREARTAAVWSDSLYAVLLALGLGLVAMFGITGIRSIVGALSIGNALALMFTNRAFLARQFHAVRLRYLAAYRLIWRDQTQWALYGVLTTEVATNAHAYAITIFYSTAAFAPIALATLFFRPVLVFLGSLIALERPLIAKHIRENDESGAKRLVKFSMAASLICWACNTTIAVAVLLFAGSRITAKHYQVSQVAVAVGLWAIIMAARAIRVPLSIFVQARDEFKELASLTGKSALIAVVAVCGLVQLSAVAALAGIAAGDVSLCIFLLGLLRKPPQSMRVRIAPMRAPLG